MLQGYGINWLAWLAYVITMLIFVLFNNINMKDLCLHVHVAHQHVTLGQPRVIPTPTSAILVQHSNQLN